MTEYWVVTEPPADLDFALQVCNGSSLGITTTDSKLHEQEFEQVDFYDLP